MKYISLLISIIVFPIDNYCQYNFNPTGGSTITVKKEPSIGESFNQLSNSRIKGQETRTLNEMAFNDAIKDNYSKIIIDKLINNLEKYKYIVVNNSTGWKPKDNTTEILQILKGSNKLEVINLSKYYNKENELPSYLEVPSNLIKNDQVLYLNFSREAVGDFNRISKLTLSDCNEKIIFESISKNQSYSEILLPLTAKYIYTKEQIIKKIEEIKKYLELEIITKEEYDSQFTYLKKMLLDNY